MDTVSEIRVPKAVSIGAGAPIVLQWNACQGYLALFRAPLVLVCLDVHAGHRTYSCCRSRSFRRYRWAIAHLRSKAARRADLPSYLQLLFSERFHTDPYRVYSVLRRDWAVVCVNWPHHGTGKCLITCFDDIAEVLGSMKAFVRRSYTEDGRSAWMSVSSEAEEPLAGTELPLDGTEHV